MARNNTIPAPVATDEERAAAFGAAESPRAHRLPRWLPKPLQCSRKAHARMGPTALTTSSPSRVILRHRWTERTNERRVALTAHLNVLGANQGHKEWLVRAPIVHDAPCSSSIPLVGTMKLTDFAGSACTSDTHIRLRQNVHIRSSNPRATNHSNLVSRGRSRLKHTCGIHTCAATQANFLTTNCR